MKANEIYIELLKLKNDELAKKMSAYMRNQFSFLGVYTEPRKNKS